MNFLSAVSNHVYLIGPIFIIAGILHFVFPGKYIRIMPGYIPWHQELVLWSGVFEVLGGIAIMIPGIKTFAGWGLIALLIAVFPANIDMFWKAWKNNHLTWYSTLLFLRLPLQFWLIYWVFAAAKLELPFLVD